MVECRLQSVGMQSCTPESQFGQLIVPFIIIVLYAHLLSQLITCNHADNGVRYNACILQRERKQQQSAQEGSSKCVMSVGRNNYYYC